MYNDKNKFIKSNKPTKKGKRFFFIPFKENDRVLSSTEKKYFKILNSELIINVIFIILGIIVYFTNLKLNVWLALSFMAYGLIKLWAFFLKNDIALFQFNIIYSIIAIIENAELIVRLKIINEKSSNYILMVSFLSLFIGILAIINPFKNLTYTQIMGAFLILYGVLNSSKIFMLKTRSYNFV